MTSISHVKHDWTQAFTFSKYINCTNAVIYALIYQISLLFIVNSPTTSWNLFMVFSQDIEPDLYGFPILTEIYLQDTR